MDFAPHDLERLRFDSIRNIGISQFFFWLLCINIPLKFSQLKIQKTPESLYHAYSLSRAFSYPVIYSFRKLSISFFPTYRKNIRCISMPLSPKYNFMYFSPSCRIARVTDCSTALPSVPLIEEESKVICNQIISFEDSRQELWVQFADKEAFFKEEDALKGILTSYPGKNPVVIYCKTERAVNRLGRDYMVSGDENLLFDLEKRYGKENIRVRSLGI